VAFNNYFLMANTVSLLFSKPSEQRSNRNTIPRIMGEIGHRAAPAHCHLDAVTSIQAHLHTSLNGREMQQAAEDSAPPTKYFAEGLNRRNSLA